MNQYELLAKFAKYGNAVFKVDKVNHSFMLTLLAYWNYQTGECFPSNESVFRGCGLSTTNLSKNKAVLKAAGLITPYFKQLGDGNKHSGYKIHSEFMAEKLTVYEQELAAKEAAELNRSNVDLFASEPEEQAHPIEPESSPFEASPIDAGEVLEPATIQTYSEPVKTPEKAIESVLEYATIEEVVAAGVAYVGEPSPDTKKIWSEKIRANGYLSVNSWNKPFKRFYLKKDE